VVTKSSATPEIMSEISTKPYLLRAIYEWCTDNGYTPYLAAAVDGRTQVPREFVKNGEIVLNISFTATGGLKLDNDFVHFHARFGGVSRDIAIPVDNVLAIYARENGQGMAFEVSSSPERTEAQTDDTAKPPALTAVPQSSEESDQQDSSSPPEPNDNGPKKSGRPRLTRVK
jgi:stringent starvation protein B